MCYYTYFSDSVVQTPAQLQLEAAAPPVAGFWFFTAVYLMLVDLILPVSRIFSNLQIFKSI